ALKGKTALFRETGYTLSDPLAGSSQTGTQDTFLDSPVGSSSVRFTFNPSTFAFMHVHYDHLKDPIFSPGDVIEFNKWLVWAKDWNSISTNMPKIDLKRLSYTVVTSLGVYTMTFDGTDVAPFTNYDIDIINNKYLEKLGSAATQTFNGETNFDMDKLEEEFLRFVKEYLPMPGMKLYKIENSGNSEIFLKPNNKRDIVPCN
ncbi:hypothetical protein, partial [Chryseobacterium aquaticum]|uniref:hypothetical protein n=1 Tax=Chryseobacterium aquaticum TaxID=452084 RepID=UPI002FC8070D